MQVGERRYAPVIGATTPATAAERALVVVGEYGRSAPVKPLHLLLGRDTRPTPEVVRVELLHLDHAGLHVAAQGPYDPLTSD